MSTFGASRLEQKARQMARHSHGNQGIRWSYYKRVKSDDRGVCVALKRAVNLHLVPTARGRSVGAAIRLATGERYIQGLHSSSSGRCFGSMNKFDCYLLADWAVFSVT